MLKDGEIDAAFLAMPNLDNQLESKKIFTEEFLLAVPTSHNFAKKKIIDQKELQGLELMLLKEGHCLRDQALEVCSMIGAVEKQTFRATSLEALRQMIIAGSGITLIPEIAAKTGDGISYLKIKNPPKRAVGLFFRKSSAKKKLMMEVAKILEVQFRIKPLKKPPNTK
jgi:LysR family hydrogen peroxide-inducible transcriptional activator